MAKDNGISVVAILFEIDVIENLTFFVKNSIISFFLNLHIENFQDDKRPNAGMKSLATLAKRLTNPKDEIKEMAFDLSQFIPENLPPVYAYDGSLTTSPFTDNVRWIVLAEPQSITSEIVIFIIRCNNIFL